MDGVSLRERIDGAALRSRIEGNVAAGRRRLTR
jgi:hypothetical protein